MATSLSVLICARNESWFLRRTVQDVLDNMRGDTEIIVVCDGNWPEGGLPADPRVHLIHHPEPVGQRAAINEAARLSTADYVMKLDAHCSVAPGFDVELMTTDVAYALPYITQIPAQYNLHAFNWVCDNCLNETYQGKQPVECALCHCAEFSQRPYWDLKANGYPGREVRSEFFRFDSELHFQYWGAYGRRGIAQGEIADVLTSLGACFFMRRARFWELGGMDEGHAGGWGQFGVEIALKSWLSGGWHVTNKRTWFAHLFRGPNFGAPYRIDPKVVDAARSYSKSLWLRDQWPGAKKPLRWLLDMFWPIPGWTEEQRDALLPETAWPVARVRNALVKVIESAYDSPPLGRMPESVIKDAIVLQRAYNAENSEKMDSLAIVRDNEFWSDPQRPVRGATTAAIRAMAPGLLDPVGTAKSKTQTKGIVYYTHGKGDSRILDAAYRRLYYLAGLTGCEIAHVELGKPEVTSHGDSLIGIRLFRRDWKPGYLTMFKQILVGLEASTADYVFLCEHDVLYHPSHFDFTPPTDSCYYYNENTWKVGTETGRAVHYRTKQTSGLCANRELLIEHYHKRVALVEAHGFTRAMGFEPGSHGRAERVDDVPSASWFSAFPNVDIRHGQNLTASRWSPSEFRNPGACLGWTEGEIPGWGPTLGRFWDWLADVNKAYSTVT